MEIPYTVTARPDTGLWNAKIGIWLFLASEVMLFGGLFSAYVFLRLGVADGVDNPWPERRLIIWPGFVNTMVLIASSVFVVFAWASLKMRKYKEYQRWMASVLLCALIFMGLKSYEYYGKFTHHGIKLNDGSVIEGVLKDDKIKFKAEAITLDLKQERIDILNSLVEGEPTFIDPDGKEFTLTRGWLLDYRTKVYNEWAPKAKAEIKAQKEDHKASGEIKAYRLPTRENSVTLKAASPLVFEFTPNKVRSSSEDSLTYRDFHRLAGEMLDDKIYFEAHDVDLRLVENREEAMAWKYLGEGMKKEFFHHRDEVYQEAKEREEEVLPAEAYMMHIHASAAPLSRAEIGGATEPAHGPEGEGSKSEAHGKHGYPLLEIDRADSRFLSNHGPGYNAYYAIYFTMTGLHGLHVLGGALVLAYFLFFNKKLYQKNPEHLANRVEVGGLFWHFVDLVWIFLFPIMYLM